ncbi:MAG: hypothetical protein AAGI53_17880 [Planctomycetota bacterium]
MFWLIRVLLPFALVAFGGLLCLVTLPVVVMGGEEQPTVVSIDQLDSSSDKKWFTIEGGVAYLPGALSDLRVNKDTGEEKIKGYYVPVLTPKDATLRALSESMDSTPDRPSALVFASFKPDDYLRRFRTPDELADNPSIDGLLVPLSVNGTRARHLIPDRLENRIRADWRLTPDQVFVINVGREPLQAGPALSIFIFAFALVVLGVVWILYRFTKLFGRSRESAVVNGAGPPATHPETPHG